MELAAAALELVLHPRVAQQGVVRAAADRAVAAVLQQLVAFKGKTARSVVACLDWDHKLPSKQFVLRVHVFYDDEARARFRAGLDQRDEEIAQKDLYPEFDVPDYGGLPADESYDADLNGALEIEALRFTSPWRREVPDEEGGRAVEAVRASAEFGEARRATPDRGSHLGDLEAVAWTPPCESGHPRWTLDVWWLTAFDGRIGRGWSFLVDVTVPGATLPILSAREFTIRAG